MISLMSFLDNTEYADNTAYSPERLAQVTDVDIYRYLANKAFGTPEPSADDLPDRCRSTTIKFHKKAISHFMPRRRMVWDEIRNEGNPTKSQAVNDLIKKIERHEVRGTGVATAARRPIEWEEYIMLLIAARHVFSHREEVMYMILAVMTLQWHFIGRIDDIMCLITTTVQRNLRNPFCLQLKMRKSKNIRSERDMPTQIFFASMDPLVCPVLNLAVYVEMFGTEGVGKNIFEGSTPSRFADYLDRLILSSRFHAVRAGKLGTHSLRKGPSTYASRFGLLRDWISLRGRWRTSKKQVDVYIDVDVPYPDAKVASVLCGPRGPCKYATRAGADLTDDFFCTIAPRCVEAFGREVGIMLARSLLWAAYEVEVRTNDEVVSLIPSDLGARIKTAYAGGGNVNPIEKIGLLVSQHMDQLDIVPVYHDGGSGEGGGGGQGGGGGGSTGGGGVGQDVADNVCCQIFHLQQIVGDMRNEVNTLFCDQRRHINTLNANVKRIALVPGVRGGAAAERPRIGIEARRVRLSKCPRDLWVLWREWEQGLGDGKPAKEFSQHERGANKFSFSRRKVFWDTVEELVKRGNTSDVSIDKIYRVYGWNKSVTKILNEMRSDRKRGVKRV